MMNSLLLPVDHIIAGFTTCSSLTLENATHIALEDKPLGVHKIFSKTAHELVLVPAEPQPQFPAPSLGWEAFYPKGSINPSGDIPGGFGFYLNGPPAFSEKLEGNAVEAVLSYRMMLQEGWEWVKGGKLPGVYGGVGDSAYGCTGGRQHERCTCFNIRLMWRAGGIGELYIYAPTTENNKKQLLSIPPKSSENADYGFSVGRGSFELPVGEWLAVALRIKLNEIGQENAEIQLWIQGKSVIHVDGLTLRDSSEGKIKGMHFQTFFGGHTADWACPKDQRAWFADVTGAIVS